MKFRAAKEWGAPNYNSGWRFILTLTHVEHRLYVWWKRANKSLYPLPLEYQRRSVRRGIVINVWPRRRSHG